MENLRDEAEYLEAPGRNEFERPYGLAWLLQLAAELREWDDPDARRWRNALASVETLAAERIREWLPKLTHPIRSGEHSQTAFAFGLILDWARSAGDDDMVALIERRIGDYYLADFDCPLRYEPSGQDFLSRAPRRRRGAPSVGARLGHRGDLRGRPLAGHLRRLPPHRPRLGAAGRPLTISRRQ